RSRNLEHVGMLLRRVEAEEPGGREQGPNRAIGRDLDLLDAALHATFGPGVPGLDGRVPDGERGVGRDPQTRPRVPNYTENERVRQPLRVRPSRPLLRAWPVVKTCTRAPDPDSTFPVFKRRRDRAAGQPAFVIDKLPLATQSPIQALRRWQQYVA